MSTTPTQILPVILSGGTGTRLWPLSREDNPKQFHDLSGQGSMLVRTIRRLQARRAGAAPIHVIASERHAERVAGDLAATGLTGEAAIHEPVGRNTAAAVALATLTTLDRFGDRFVLVVPSDHEITPDEEFWRSVEEGTEAARAGSLVVFGIRPTTPETGYGYIRAAMAEEGAATVPVEAFVEKPDLETARAYLADLKKTRRYQRDVY